MVLIISSVFRHNTECSYLYLYNWRFHRAVLHVQVIHLVFCNCYCRGTRIKTRKRNIAAPLDPASFSDAIVQIYLDNGGDLVRPSLGVPFASHMLFLLLRDVHSDLWNEMFLM